MTSPNRYSPNTVLFITVNLLVKKCQVRKKKGWRGDIGQNEEKEKGRELVQCKREPLIIFPRPQTKDLDLFM